MTRASRPERATPSIDELLAIGDGAPTIEQKVEIARTLRAALADGSRQLDRVLLEQITNLRIGLHAAQAAQEELGELLERLASPPWHPALFLRAVTTELGARAMVLYGGARRVVSVAESIELERLVAGEEVFLGSEGNVVAGRSPYGTPQYGETAFFDRITPDGRCVIRWRDEEIVVDAAGTLDVHALVAGDQLRWDRAAWMAFEKMVSTAGRRFLLDQVPDVDRGRVGGQEANLATMLAALTATLVDPELAAAYGVGGRQSILMVGPPGCGKTLIVRVVAAEISRLSGRRCPFAVVKPAEWESPWVGTTQQNIRDCFKTLREESEGLGVLFLDEIESIGRIRGTYGDHHADKFLAALLAELDGFTERSGIAVIAATNRKTLVDPALLERLSDVEIVVERPDMRGARAIFDIHLSPTVPLRSRGGSPSEVRDEIIDMAVSRLYSPNGDNDLCVLRFRDGKSRTVGARELASGRMIAQICRAARLEAFRRAQRVGTQGLDVPDMERAVEETIVRLSTTLSPRNVQDHLAGLPQDIDVVSVEPIARRVRLSRYRRAA